MIQIYIRFNTDSKIDLQLTCLLNMKCFLEVCGYVGGGVERKIVFGLEIGNFYLQEFCNSLQTTERCFLAKEMFSCYRLNS